MMQLNKTATLIALVLLSACTTTAPPADRPVVEVSRYLVDPRIGFAGSSAGNEKRFGAAWKTFLQGRLMEAGRKFTDLEKRDPTYRPATLALAAVALEEQELDRAEALITQAQKGTTNYTAAEIYSAELALRRGQVESAYASYQALAGRPDFPSTSTERLSEIRKDLFETLYRRATEEADPARAVTLLRQAMALSPEASVPRIVLVQKLVQLSRFEEARREIEPLIAMGEVQRSEVQEALGEIDFGKGRYQEAITRYERLNRKDPNPRYAARLRQMKDRWNELNMPPQFQRAIESPAVNREDYAVLVYWKIPAVRFAHNLREPPIAVDITEVIGREELIRALALRMFDVDPVTRRVYPYREMSGSGVIRRLATLVTRLGAPVCAQPAMSESSDNVRHQRMLESCAVDISALRAAPDGPVTGRQLASLAEQVARAMSPE